MDPLDFHVMAPSILPKRLARWRDALTAAALCYQLDPFLLAAIMDRESNGGSALAPDGTGDKGHGRGLMQIDNRAHPSFTSATFDDGTPLWKDEAFNALYAARLLRKNLLFFGGDEAAAVAAYNCGPGNVRKALREAGARISEADRIAAVERYTAGGDYVTDVRRRRSSYLEALQKQLNPQSPEVENA